MINLRSYKQFVFVCWLFLFSMFEFEPLEGSNCTLEHETLPSLLSIGSMVQECLTPLYTEHRLCPQIYFF